MIINNYKEQYIVKKQKNKIFKNKESLSYIFFALIVIYVCFLIVPIIGLIKYSGIKKILETINNVDNIYCLKLSMKTSLISLLLTFLFGTPTAFYLSKISKNKIPKIVDIIVELPIVLPPAVVGIGLLLAFGDNGIIGSIFSKLGYSITFTPIAVIIAQLFVSSSLYIKVLKNSIQDIPKEIFEVSYVLGASKITTIIKVIIPMLKRTVISALILSWIRALGEFGATLMFAGNVMNKTRTIPLQIYTYMQTDIKMATAFAGILYILSFIMILTIRVLLREKSE
ncbi:ABC transporter permease [Clostridium taeniosporum]|uniref:Molybdenum transport system permease n=1 Tax=Clostridium taeniosporum TaxID=394958 RepID=A0A1D7XN42_9CLOT|nr:ABC transporter permease [Clostridium taeniosporum]AOR24758.1 molybdate ABC transporter permease subunit [Clostridium taeniosporum]